MDLVPCVGKMSTMSGRLVRIVPSVDVYVCIVCPDRSCVYAIILYLTCIQRCIQGKGEGSKEEWPEGYKELSNVEY